MAKLTQQLKYFINKKISEDVDWQGVEVVLSGHEVPGEGEHKIMEYIRLAKAQPDYDPNMRHCLYGLDADLIMLGLLSHDPHFCLLREEVTFGRQSQKKSKELEHQNFYLMHLCIVREYLELEFQELKQPGVLNFPFDMERVIDDFILMAFFVGNDFLPNLPNLHINEGALALMFKVYKSVIPKGTGYINEQGVINLDRLGCLLEELSNVEYRFFESENSNANWFKSKQMSKVDVMDSSKGKGKMVMSKEQKGIYQNIKAFVQSDGALDSSERRAMDLSATLPARDRKFVEDLADGMGLEWKTVENDDGNRHLRLQLPQKQATGSEDDSDDDEETEERQRTMLKVMRQYEKAKVIDATAEAAQNEMEEKYQAKFQEWKDKYYREKFDWGLDDEGALKALARNYVQGLQWVLFYYYRGVASWPWFYGYHYSPMISGTNISRFLMARLVLTGSDVKKGLDADLEFHLGQPFRPFQQLMGVLPDRSKTIVPLPYHDLMTNPDSPIIDFYPRNFELDMNGKKMDWEAVVKIPFIDEKRLLDAMRPKDAMLTEDEIARNEFGVTLQFSYSAGLDYVYPSSLVGIFPDIPHCRCVVNIFELPTLEGLDVYVGLMDGVKLGKEALAGFPSLKTLSHTGRLEFHGVNVFQQDSRNESMVITLESSEERTKVEAAKAKLGKKVHVGYPFLQEAKIVRVSDELFDYIIPESGFGAVMPIPHSPQEIEQWKKKADRIRGQYSKRLGMEIGDVESLVHVEMLKGLKKTDDGAVTKEYALVQGIETDYASQIIVDEVISEDQRFLEKPALPIEAEFPKESRAFFLGEFNYGRPSIVIGHSGERADIFVATLKGREPEFGREFAALADETNPYSPSYAVARMLNLNPLVLSKITASFSVMLNDQRLNLGLNLKFEAKKLKVLGYSRRTPEGWQFSLRAIELIQQYMIRFPEFIAGVQRKPQGDLYQATDFYPPEEAQTKLKEIQAWLKSIEAKHFERVPLDAEQLDSEIVLQIEKAADQLNQSSPDVEGKKIKGVPRNALLKPADAEHRLGNQRFSLGDRVTYVQDSGKVPISCRGTVVGLTRTSRTMLLDVVFDVVFMSGTTLSDRCSPFRGSTVPVSSVLNLTDRQLITRTKAGAGQRAVSTPVTSTGARYGIPAGPKGEGQFVEARQPPPMRVAWREAASAPPLATRGGMAPRGRAGINGTGRGSNHIPNTPRDLPTRESPQSHQPPNHHHRGRGNHPNGHTRGVFHRPRGKMNSQGYTPLESGLPQEGVVPNNPNFRPQPYNNVPPPASLDTQARGRGRGGGFRGGNTRGRGAPRRGALHVNQAQ